MDKKIFYRIIKSLITLIIVCSLIYLIVYILSHFMPLHPNAYTDIIRSIVIVYGFVLIVYILIAVLRKIKQVNKAFKGIGNWWKDQTPIKAISEFFTVITVINNLMMITGYDTPKQELFTYIHMLTRFAIITLVITITMWKVVIKSIKQMKYKQIFKDFFENLPNQFFGSISKLFTFITVVYCMFIILFQSIINPTGGLGFYKLLLVFFGLSIICILFLRNARKQK